MTFITEAAIATAAGEPLIIEEVRLRAPGPRELLIEMKASGLCHTDLSILQGAFPVPLPAILGHEGAGIVVECGPEVDGIKPGDHVILNNVIRCGQCEPCRLERHAGCHLMAQRDSMAFEWRGRPLLTLGGIASFARHTVMRQEQVTTVPAALSFASAAVVPCGVLTGAGAVWNDARITPGSSVVVAGLGSIGLNAVQAARIAGAGRIVAIDVNQAKEAVARQFGATDFLSPARSSEGLEKQICAILGAHVDYAFECAGNTELLARLVEAVHPYWGVCVAVGVPPQHQTISLPASSFVLGRSVRGTHIGNGDPVPDTLKVLNGYFKGTFKLDELVTHRIPLEWINQGFEFMKQGKSIRTVVVY